MSDFIRVAPLTELREKNVIVVRVNCARLRFLRMKTARLRWIIAVRIWDFRCIVARFRMVFLPATGIMRVSICAVAARFDPFADDVPAFDVEILDGVVFVAPNRVRRRAAIITCAA